MPAEQYTIPDDSLRCCTTCHESKPLADFYAHKNLRRCKACLRKIQKKYYETHKNARRAWQRIYDHAHPEKNRLRKRAYRQANPCFDRDYYKSTAVRERRRLRRQERGPIVAKRVRKRVPGIKIHVVYRICARGRRAGLPVLFTKPDYEFMLMYFDSACAVCHTPETDVRKLHADHWVPLADPLCPGTIAENIVPLCSGRGGCNGKKGNLPPEIWLLRCFGQEQACLILQSILNYFEEVGKRKKL